MTDQERKLIFTVAGSSPENFPLIHQIQQGFKRGNEMLHVCVSMGLIDKKFTQLWQDNGGSKMKVGSFLLKYLNKDKSRKLHIKDLL